MASGKQSAHASVSHPIDLDSYLPHLLSITGARLSSLLATQYEEDVGIGIHEWRVLSVVAIHQAISVNFVAANTSISKVAVSRAVTRLLASKLIKSSQNPNDARLVMLSITAAGRRVYENVAPTATLLDATVRDVLGAADHEHLRRILRTLKNAVTSGEVVDDFEARLATRLDNSAQ